MRNRKILDGVADAVMENSRFLPTDYFDEQGLRRCGICEERKENIHILLGTKRVFPCLCACERKELEEKQKEDQRRQFEIRVGALKSVGLTEPRFREWRFENDNRNNPKMKLARAYVEHWDEMFRKNLGYVLWGPVGTGKSFFAGCIANALMEQGISVMMTNFSRILNELNARYKERNDVISQLTEFPLLIIDDFGIERESSYAMEMIYNVIDRRYCIQKPMIITTNLTYQEMTDPRADQTRQRIYSRMFEMCTPVLMDGKDQRKELHVEKRKELSSVLGI